MNSLCLIPPVGYIGCNGDALSPNERQQYNDARQKQDAERMQADKMGVSVERMQEMQAYAAILRRKHPQFSESRLQRKVAEHFKIKLV